MLFPFIFFFSIKKDRFFNDFLPTSADKFHTLSPKHQEQSASSHCAGEKEEENSVVVVVAAAVDVK